MRRAALAGLGLLVAASAGVGALAWKRARGSPGRLPSNVLPEDYVGPDACGECHQAKYRSWQSTAHSRMNQNPEASRVKGDFSGKRVRVPGGEAVFTHEGDDYFVALERRNKLVRRYKVTRVVGSRFMQFYIGTQVEGPEPRTSPLYTEETKLPYGYWFRLERWLPETYFDPGPPEIAADGTPSFDPFDKPRDHEWKKSCIACHNTYPYLYRLGTLDHAGFPRGDLALDQPAVLHELVRAGVLHRRIAAEGTEVYVQLSPEKLVTLGISCESCHFGGRAHAKGELDTPSFGPTTPLARVEPKDAHFDATPSRKNAYAVNAICAQCHCAIVPLFPNGAGTWNSREALDLEAGACASKIKCTDCHDPHKPGPPEGTEDPLQVGACLRCHTAYSDPARAAEHSGHDARVSCLDCHMPKISQGLEEVVRSHRISSPTDPRMLEVASANACNLCHLDRSIRWTLDSLAKTWGKRIEPGPAWARAYGSLDAPVGRAWLSSEDPFVRVIATQAYAGSPLGKPAIADLLPSLDDPVPVNRVFGQLALERIFGKPLGSVYDVVAPSDERRRAIEALRTALR
jgi:hypothetical protein